MPYLIKYLIPQAKIQVEKLNIPDNILVNLAYPVFHIPAEIDMLAAAGTYYTLLLDCIIRLGKGIATLVNT